MEHEIKHKQNLTNGLFFIEDESGILSELTYTRHDNQVLVIDHTETRRQLEGQGLASKLLEAVVNFAKKNEYKIDPLCPFAEVKFDQNEDYQKIKVE